MAKQADIDTADQLRAALHRKLDKWLDGLTGKSLEMCGELKYQVIESWTDESSTRLPVVRVVVTEEEQFPADV